MKTIDEVIERYKYMAKESRETARRMKPDEMNIVFINDLFEFAEEQEQISNWLKELKAYREAMKEIREKADCFKDSLFGDGMRCCQQIIERVMKENKKEETK